MPFSRTKTRFLSLFVFAFLCLNAGGVFCLAYCGQAVKARAANHCPLKKKGSDHCHGSKKTTQTTDTDSLEASSVKCCLLPISLFATPLEAKYGVAIDAVTVANIETPDFAPILLVRSRQLPKFYYRPPPNDRGTDRVRNQVFRI